MASLRVPSVSFMQAFLPIARAQLFPQLSPRTNRRIPLLQRSRIPNTLSPLLPAALASIPSALSSLKDALGEIWDGLLNAVPKKKTSHMKKRHRQMAGKALKDVTALNKCSACGRTKRAHILCPYCVQSIKRWFGNGFKTQAEVDAEEREMFEKYNEELRIRGKKLLELPKKDGNGRSSAKPSDSEDST